MKEKILISAPYLLPFMDRFMPIFQKHDLEVILPEVNERLEEEDLLEVISDIDGVICGDDRFTEKVLDAAKKLKVISKWGTGIDSINKEACTERGIAVCNTLNAFTVPVSDSVMSYMLSFARKTPWMDKAMHGGSWEKIPGRALSECTLGIIGIGNIGSMLAKKASAFDMEILGNDLKEIDAKIISETGLKVSTFEELLEKSDFVSVCCDLNPTSEHLLNASAFSKMKKGAILINTARGPIVDEKALIEALTVGKLAGAGLDVFEHEPLPKDSPLLAMENVLMAPHNSNSSPTAWEKVHHNTINNLLRVLGKVD